MTTRSNAVDKRRLILDAAIRVFAREGFHHCRVSEIANEAGVAYGLVYHYFRSKDEVLDTLFTERWTLLLEAISEVDARDLPIRDKLHAIASFIIDSYQHDPDLMKVIIVEVTRAANTFGRAHLEEISQAYEGIATIIRKAQDAGELDPALPPSAVAHFCLSLAVGTALVAPDLDDADDEEWATFLARLVPALAPPIGAAT